MPIEKQNFICDIISEFNRINVETIIDKLDNWKSYLNDVEIKCCTQKNLNHNANGKMFCDKAWNCIAMIYPYNMNEFIDAIYQNYLHDGAGELLSDGILNRLFSKLFSREDYTMLRLLIELIICHELVHAIQTKKLQIQFSVIKEDIEWERCCERVSDTIAKAYLINAYNNLGLRISNYYLLYRFGSSGSSYFVDGVKKYCKKDTTQTILSQKNYCQVFAGGEMEATTLLLENYLPLSETSIFMNKFYEWSVNHAI